MDISNAVVIVTGASSGIGLATARLLGAQGARVVLAARSADTLAQVAAELPDALAIPTDMSDVAAIQHMVAAAQAQYGRVDVLINNAGRGLHVPIEELNLDQYRQLVDLNLVGVLAAMQAVIPIMRAQGGGVIINISSGLSKMLVPGVAPYASTKYALNALTLTARHELARDNIRVGVMYPGVTATNFAQNVIARSANAGSSGMQAETAEQVAVKIAEAITTEAAETYADSLAAFAPRPAGQSPA
ncbi:MAG: SDR family oxidoreductase [Ktedonobacterales bacterium]|nr:SDR family oxidoreductase [Ktedonobacterales bacterium]